MSETRPCPVCAQIREVELVEREENVTMKGREVTFLARVYRCRHCGEEFETPEQLDANLLAARQAYKTRYDSVSPDDLRALRARYGASQKAFGLILGFGELTINTYEQGGTPNEPNRNLLRLAQDPAVFQRMYRDNKDKIGALQRKRIEQSAAFRRMTAWRGMEGLYDSLGAEERETVEKAAANHAMPIPQLVREYLLPPLNRENLRPLPREWEEGEWSRLPEASGCLDSVAECLEGVGA